MQDLRNNLPALYDFYIVAKEKNYSKAGEKNFVSHSNLGRNVRNLEETLNTKLVISSNKGIELTLDGEKLFKELDKVFSHLKEFSNQEIGGKLIIGTTRNIADYRLEKYLTRFHKEYPNVTIKIVTDSASNLNEYLTKHSIDVLIDYLPHINFSEKYEFEVRAIEQFDTYFACSKEFYQKNGKNINKLQDLTQYNLVIPGASRRRQLLDKVLQTNNITLKPNIEMPDSKLMADFVKANPYIGYLTEEEINNSNLIKLKLEEALPSNSIGIIYPKNTMNYASKKFVELVLNDICANLDSTL